MKIQSYGIEMYANSESFKKHSITETLDITVNTNESRNNDGNQIQSDNPENGVLLFISDQGKEKLLSTQTQKTDKTHSEFELSDKDKQKIQLIEKFIEALTGKRYKIRLHEKINLDESCEGFKEVKLQNRNNVQAPRPNWGLVYNRSETYEETQKMNFSATGIVKTSDGREINFNLNLNMDYQYSQSSNVILKAGAAAIDPLVINFDGTLPALTADKYDFDINIDGVAEKISMPTQGSGFLAIDKNNDGVINDGSELFGPSTNDGFRELSELDSDGNGWLDENDAMFSNVKIMVKSNESESPELFSLKDKNIGAIFLDAVGSPYEIKNTNNETSGVIRKTGVFLKEDGSSGLVQHIDVSA